MKILQGDTVQVIAGKDKGKTGTVVKTLPDQDRVVVDGVNEVTRHQKNRRVRSQGQLITKNMPIHVSNVAVLHNGKPVRIGYSIEGAGAGSKKVRVARPSGEKL
jgi:large subunit ribosomal protein L24